MSEAALAAASVCVGVRSALAPPANCQNPESRRRSRSRPTTECHRQPDPSLKVHSSLGADLVWLSPLAERGGADRDMSGPSQTVCHF